MWDNLPLLPERASTLAGEVDALFFFAVGVAVFFSLLIAFLIVLFAVRYHRRHPDEVGIPEKASLPLEITWTLIPLVIVLFIFAWGTKVFFQAVRVPSNAVEYFVTGKQWMWKIQHPEGMREINELHVPVNTPIKLTMTSEDVIHSFYIPAFRIKQDVLPGRYTTLWFEATQTGSFKLFCAEYCGAEHAQMIGRVVVMEPHEYSNWLARDGGPAMALSGEKLFQQHACNTCHQPSSGERAPILNGVAGSEVQLADGRTLVADDNYLRQSILQPAASVVAGYQPRMPTYQGLIREEELLQLIQYIKGLEPVKGETP